MSSTVREQLFALMAAAAITLVFIAKPPPHGARWDAPIYLQRGKIAAETPLLDSYRKHADEIAAGLPQYKPGGGRHAVLGLHAPGACWSRC